MNKTKIEWTDATWNPIRGCSRVSEGCRNCYAEKVAYRFSGPGQPYEGLATEVNGHAAWTGEVRFIEKHLLDPLRWKEPRRIFVNSMSDLFHENVHRVDLKLIFAVMLLCPQHTFQVLTKRAANIHAILNEPGFRSEVMATAAQLAFDLASLKAYARIPKSNSATDILYDCGANGDEAGCRVRCDWPLANVWLGVSVENQAAADERIPLLLETPAAVRFISAEPLLGPVNLNRIEVMEGEVDRSDPENPIVSGYCIDAMSGEAFDDEYGSLSTAPDGEVPLERGIDWVIVGGESGSGARPMHPDWARSLRDQCHPAAVPFFFKQWGEWAPKSHFVNFRQWNRAAEHALVYHDGLFDSNPGADEPDQEFGLTCADLDGNDGAQAMGRVGKKAAGALLDGRGWREFPAVRP